MRIFVPAASILLAFLLVRCSSTSSGSGGEVSLPPVSDPFDAATVPVNVDCSDPRNCVHLACYHSSACQNTTDPGGCPVGMVRDQRLHVCRQCTAQDCDGTPMFCCGADVCKPSPICAMYTCADIPAMCNGTTSGTCGFRDLDDDDGFGNCDVGLTDPCCTCKVAVGCAQSSITASSLCSFGQQLKNGKCVACTKSDCAAIPCMGMNGCPTNCPPGQFFGGVGCRDCTGGNGTSQASDIPACVNGPGGTMDGGGMPAGDAAGD